MLRQEILDPRGKRHSGKLHILVGKGCDGCDPLLRDAVALNRSLDLNTVAGNGIGNPEQQREGPAQMADVAAGKIELREPPMKGEQSGTKRELRNRQPA